MRTSCLRTAPRFIKYNLMRSLHEQEQMKEMNQLRFVPRCPSQHPFEFIFSLKVAFRWSSRSLKGMESIISSSEIHG